MSADLDKKIIDIDIHNPTETMFFNECLPSGFAIISIDPTMQFIFVNDKLVKMLRYDSREEMLEAVGNALWSCVHPDDLASSKALMVSREDCFEPLELTYRMCCKDGSYIWGHQVSQKIIDKSGKTMIFAYYTDITKQKELEQQILAEKAKLEKITIKMNKKNIALQKRYEEELKYRNLVNEECLITLKINLTQNLVEDCSTTKENFVELKKYKKITELFDRVQASLFDEQDVESMRAVLDRPRLLELYFMGEKIFRTEYRRVLGDNTVNWIGVTVKLLEEPKTHDVVGFIYTVDINEKISKEHKQEKILKEALEIAERANNAKSEFLSRMSHEIRTPMNAIIGMTEIAVGNMDNGKYLKQCLENIQMSSKYLLTLLNDVLDMSRIENRKIELMPSIIDRKQFVRELSAIIMTQAEKAKIEYTISFDENCNDYFIGDVIRLKQILINLLNNAIKFTEEGGTIRVTAEQISVIGDQVTLRFIIEDNGIGMSKEFVKHVFEPFAQEHAGNIKAEGGSGLGLAISKNLAELMSGNIEVESELGKGSKFTVTLKLKQADGEAVKMVQEKHERSLEDIDFTGERVLLVEDQPLNQTVAMLILEKKNCMVESAENGQIGVDKFQNSAEGYYSAILMDISMPVMDGLEATRRIRALHREDAKTVPIIAMTANAFNEDIGKSFSAGMNAHLSKPIESLTLYETLFLSIAQSKKEFRI